MNKALKEAHARIMKAECAEDIFGVLDDLDPDSQTQEVSRIFRTLSKKVHPDKFSTKKKESETADEAFKRLNELHQKAKIKLEDGSYGDRVDPEEEEDEEFLVETRKGEYLLKSVLAEGDISTVYSGIATAGPIEGRKVALKLVDDEEDNDLAKNEIRVIRQLKIDPGSQDKHLPVLVDNFKTTDGRLGLVFEELEECFDIYSVREKYPDGVNEKDAVWMFNRLLSGLGYVHRRGVIHGNIEPAHIMIRPRDHNLFLIDWSYAIYKPGKTDDGFKVANDDYTAPEALAGKPPLPSADLYSVGKCMIYILGGDLSTNKLPKTVNKRLQRFVEFFVRESAIGRPQDAWRMHKELISLIESLWGPRQFREFVM